MLESFVVKDYTTNQVQFHSNMHLTILLSQHLHSQPVQPAVENVSIDVSGTNQEHMPQRNTSELTQNIVSAMLPESMPVETPTELQTLSLDPVPITTQSSLSSPCTVESNIVNSKYVVPAVPANSGQMITSLLVPQNSNSTLVATSLSECPKIHPSTLPTIIVNSISKECQTVNQTCVSVGVNTEDNHFVTSIKAEKSYATRTEQLHVAKEMTEDSHSDKSKSKSKELVKEKIVNAQTNKRYQPKRKQKKLKDREYFPSKKGKITGVKEHKQFHDIDEVGEKPNSKLKAKRELGQIEFKNYNPKNRLPPPPKENAEFVEIIKASNQSDFYCVLCPDSPRFTKETEYVCHVKDSHMKPAEIGFMFSCEQCDRTFTLQHERHKHKWRKFLGGLFHHLITQHAMEWPDFMDVYKCKKCGVYISPRSQNVYIHLTRCGVRQNEIKRTVCLHCGKQYVSAGQHMKYCNKRLVFP